MKKTALPFLFLILFSSCRDIVFDNPFDPNLSKLQVKILKVVDTTLKGNGDLCWDGEKLWFASENGTLYALEPESATVLREIPVGGMPSGITFLQGLLYVSFGADGDLITVDPVSETVINEMPMGDRLPQLITTDGNLLFIYDSRTESIYSFNQETGEFSFLFKITGFRPSGMEYSGGNIVLVERTNLSIYVISLSGEIQKTYDSPTNYPGGITVDGMGNFYLISTDGKLYKISLQ